VQQTAQLEHERNLVQLEGASAIVERERQAIEDINRKAKIGGDDAEFQKQRVLAHDLAIRQIGKLEEDYQRKMEELTRGTTASQLQGVAKVTADTKNKILELELEFQRTFGALKEDDANYVAAHRAMEEAKTAITQNAEEQRRVIRRQAADETADLEKRAAIAGLPEWQRANAQILEDYRERIRQINEAEADLTRGIQVGSDEYVRISEDANRRRVAAWVQANGQIADENRQMTRALADDLVSIWDDIANGNIGKTIMNLVKKLIAQIIAQFLLGFASVRNAFGGGQQNGTGLIGGFLQMLFGGGGAGGGGGFGGGTTALGGAGGLFNVGLGAPGIVGSGGGIVNGGGFGGTLLSGGSGLGASVQGGVSTVGGANQSLLGRVFGRFFGGNQLAASSIVGGGMMGLSAIIGGLQGGGVVNSAIQGGLGGAMTGFGVSLLAGGPIGAAVGGAIFLASLLAGIFGGGGSRAQAMARGQFLPQISKTKDDYMAHVLEFQAALQQLAQIGANAQQQLGQFGKPGLKAFGTTVQPAIDDATRAILMTERERKARRDIPLNEGQFHVGGLIGPNGMPGGPERANEVRIRALAGEYVVNPQATARNLGLLEQINSGGSPSGGGGNTYNLNFLDVGGLDDWLDAGGAEKLQEGLDRFDLRYSGGSA
jgi:hypothetical protein